jgi:hypothetical protein
MAKMPKATVDIQFNQIDPLLRDILCAMLSNSSLHRGNSLDDDAVIKMACRLRAKLVDEKLAEPVIPGAKS